MKIDRYDIGMMMAAGLFMVTRLLTRIYFSLLQNFMEVTESIVTIYEANPTLVEPLIRVTQMSEVFYYLFAPAVIFAIYIFSHFIFPRPLRCLTNPVNRRVCILLGKPPQVLTICL